jgi:hypothetical protein
MTLGRPSPAMAVALVALFVAAGGSSYAAVKLNGKDIKNRTIAAKKLKRNTLGGVEIDESRLGRVASADNAGLLGGLGPGAFLGATAKAADADKLDGQDSTAFLGASGKAADADKLDGQDSTAFLGASAKAADADRLDGRDSTQVGGILTGRIDNGSSFTTTFAPPSGTTTQSNTSADETESSFQQLSPAVPTRIGNLSVRGAAGNQTYTLVLRVDGSDTDVACTVGDGETTCQDTDTVSVPPGSLLSIKRQFNGAPPATIAFGLTVAMD